MATQRPHYDEHVAHWAPNDAARWRRDRDPQEGDLVGFDFKPWRVLSIKPCARREDEAENLTPHIIILRPAHIDKDWQTAHSEDLHLRGRRRPTSYDMPVLNPHYGLCVHCGELTPCREVMIQRRAAAEVARMKRYDQPGVCPSCREVVTHRQESEVFPNIVVPGGPPVTYHMGRRACRFAAEQYRKKLGEPDSQLTFGDAS